MTSFYFTFDLRDQNHLIATIDARAIIARDENLTVEIPDLATGEWFEIKGALENTALSWLQAEENTRLTEAIEESRLGAITYDREIWR